MKKVFKNLSLSILLVAAFAASSFAESHIFNEDFRRKVSSFVLSEFEAEKKGQPASNASKQEYKKLRAELKKYDKNAKSLDLDELGQLDQYYKALEMVRQRLEK